MSELASTGDSLASTERGATQKWNIREMNSAIYSSFLRFYWNTHPSALHKCEDIWWCAFYICMCVTYRSHSCCLDLCVSAAAAWSWAGPCQFLAKLYPPRCFVPSAPELGFSVYTGKVFKCISTLQLYKKRTKTPPLFFIQQVCFLLNTRETLMATPCFLRLIAAAY